jgi:DNA (cytosine-5)-methyltransferase 1
MRQLVLSLFPGIDLLGRAFAQAGFCVVTGPELIFGSRIEDFRGAAGRFDGVLGGPPCQDFSCARQKRPIYDGDGVRLLREFLRVVSECRPLWWLCENVPRVPDLRLDGYTVQRLDLWDLECGARQRRCRHIQFGHRLGHVIRPRRKILTGTQAVRVVTARAASLASHYGRQSMAEHCRDQGLETTLDAPALRPRALWRAVGNGVPLTMGRALAEAVLNASPFDPSADCACGCGRPVDRRKQANQSCRKRMERRRRGGRSVVTWP